MTAFVLVTLVAIGLAFTQLYKDVESLIEEVLDLGEALRETHSVQKGILKSLKGLAEETEAALQDFEERIKE